jgi:hypothetical protein
MDRLTRTLAGCGLVTLLAVTGCRSTRSEVPPGPPYTKDGKQVPPIGFNSDPHPLNGGAAGLGPGGMPAAGNVQYGMPGTASGPNFGIPSGNAYGPPGTAGAAGATQMPAGESASSRAPIMPGPGQ